MMARAPRSDAQRNREAILAAADALFTDRGSWDTASMATVAQAAGVGKATVFRAFGDSAGLLRAVMARRSGDLLERLEDGSESPAAGSPTERVAAILEALLAFKLANRQLSLALDAVGSGSPYLADTYGRWHAILAAELRPSLGSDGSFTAHALLAAVRSDLLEHLIGEEGRDEAELGAELRAHVGRVLGGTAIAGRRGADRSV